ncbi:hypothetical protein C8F04DRAFT_1068686 [Mycena alexandri]|uniref:Uncharacterized protein n=1 Tax=Mycena alexandri TaxID=1745969 RepID=A0AAD6TDF8_9AGAR|nr:hypothetical protein C8F04DRAFT_1068686 [Mycena alexandri]
MEEDIDNETLQAQIDLSLSFAQNLVSSWVKPAKNPTKNSSRALEAELKEIMRRPPRLGVGAPIPEVAATSSRDTQRLKSHLSGKKRARGDDDEAAKQISDNEEDSRGASVKKKMRIDPFEASSKKKKKEAKVSPPPRSTPPPPKEKPEVNKKPSIEQALSGDVSPPEPSSPPLSSSKKKKKKHKNKNQTPTDSEPLLGPNKVPYGLASSNVNGASIAKSPETSPAPEVLDISLITTEPLASPVSPARRLQNGPLLKGPILNLTGPPPSDESGEEEAAPGTPSTSPKRKRRKRKKNKSLLGAQHSL